MSPIVCLTMTLERVKPELASLSDFGGFRNYCQARARELGVTGHIQGVLNRDMVTLFEGGPSQCTAYFNFLKNCRAQDSLIGEIKDVQNDER